MADTPAAPHVGDLLSLFDEASALLKALLHAIAASDASDEDKREASAQIEGNAFGALAEAQGILGIGCDDDL